MSEDDYSDDFSREDFNQNGNKKTFLIDEAVEIEGDKERSQNINRIDNDSKKLKKPQVYSGDEDHYSFAANSNFQFKEPDHFTHWKTIDKVDLKNIIAGDIQQLNTIMNELAFSNFNDPAFVAPTKEGRNALQIMQFSLQYMMFTQNEIANRIKVLHNYIDQGKQQLTQIRKIENSQKDRIKKQKKTDRKLNEQAIHYEFLIKKFRPDLQPEKLEELHKDLDILSQVAEGKSLAKIEQQSIKETKQQLAKVQEIEELKKSKKPVTAEASIDVQQDFMKEIKDKLEKEFDRERRKMEEKIGQKDLEIKKMDLEISSIKMSELNLDDYQAQRVRALTKIMQEVVKNEDRQDEESVARLFGLDKIIKNERAENDKDEAKKIQRDMEQRLESERRKFRENEKDIEKKAYDKAKQEFDFELKKTELEHKQKEINDQKLKEEQAKLAKDKENKDKRSRLKVDSNINPLSISSAPKKIKFDTQHIKEAEEDDIEEDIYSEEFDEYDSNKFDKNEKDDLEESKTTDRPPKGKSAGQKLINKFSNYNDSIEEDGTIDFNLTKTGSVLDTLPFPKNIIQSQSKNK